MGMGVPCHLCGSPRTTLGNLYRLHHVSPGGQTQTVRPDGTFTHQAISAAPKGNVRVYFVLFPL